MEGTDFIRGRGPRRNLPGLIRDYFSLCAILLSLLFSTMIITSPTGPLLEPVLPPWLGSDQDGLRYYRI